MGGVLIIFIKCSKSTRSGIDISGKFEFSFSFFFVPGKDAECEDKGDKCAARARNGDCLKNAEYMLVKCRKSCLMCGSTATGFKRKIASSL